MKRSILTILLITTFSIAICAQPIGKTYFGISADIAKYDYWFHLNDLSEISLYYEVNRLWNKNAEKPFSIATELGVGIKPINLARGSGGLGQGGNYEGNYWQLIFGGALLGQIKTKKNTSFLIGPRIESLIVAYEKSRYKWWGYQYVDGEYRGTGGTTKVNEFNRNYFNKVYYGLNLKILTKVANKESTYGFNICYLFTEKSDSNFNTNSLVRLGIIIQL